MYRKIFNRFLFSKARNVETPQNQDLPINNGGIKTINRDILKKFQTTKLQEAKRTLTQDQTFVRSVQALKAGVLEDPVLKMSLEAGLREIPKGGILHGVTPNELFETLNSFCVNAPRFLDDQIAGVPFLSLFFDLMETKGGQAFFSSKPVNQYLKQVFQEYNIMLSSKASLKYMNEEEPYGWFCETARKYVNYDDYYVDKTKPHWGFNCWNDWFTRPVRPEARPVDPRPNSIVHSSDSYPLYFKPGQLGRNPYRNVKAQDSFWSKDNLYSLYDTLGAKKMGITDLVDQHFVGGTVYQAFLDPWCYHRWHAPVSGTVVKSYKLEGTYYYANPNLQPTMNVKSTAKTYIQSMPMLSAVSTRQIFIIRLDDGSNRHVAVIEIGMAEVSSCKPIVIQGQKVNKGDQLGRFEFGGSSYSMIFDKDFDLTFNPAISVINSATNETNKALVNSWLALYK